MALIADIVQIYRNYTTSGRRSSSHRYEPAACRGGGETRRPCRDGAAGGAAALFNHPLTDKGLAAFLADWAKTGQQIA